MYIKLQKQQGDSTYLYRAVALHLFKMLTLLSSKIAAQDCAEGGRTPRFWARGSHDASAEEKGVSIHVIHVATANRLHLLDCQFAHVYLQPKCTSANR